jgi:hypothetical protein
MLVMSPSTTPDEPCHVLAAEDLSAIAPMGGSCSFSDWMVRVLIGAPQDQIRFACRVTAFLVNGRTHRLASGDGSG